MKTPVAVWLALLAAALFGGSTPFVKLLIGDSSPLLVAGLLYLGSGLGLAVARLLRDQGWQASGLSGADQPWFAGAIRQVLESGQTRRQMSSDVLDDA